VQRAQTLPAYVLPCQLPQSCSIVDSAKHSPPGARQLPPTHCCSAVRSDPAGAKHTQCGSTINNHTLDAEQSTPTSQLGLPAPICHSCTVLLLRAASDPPQSCVLCLLTAHPGLRSGAAAALRACPPPLLPGCAAAPAGTPADGSVGSKV
jgi:hypothetical protein